MRILIRILVFPVRVALWTFYKFRDWSNLIQAIVFGITITMAFGLLYLWVLWRYPFPAGDPATQLSLRLGVGQVVTGFAALLLTGVLGFFAVREFSEQQARPRLRLMFSVGGNLYSDVRGHFGSSETVSLGFSVDNAGSAIALWYMVELKAPILTSWASQYQKEKEDRDGWQREMLRAGLSMTAGDDYTWLQDGETGMFSLVFMSRGIYAVYPHGSLPIWILKVPVAFVQPNETYEFEYKISSDKEKIITGTLTFVLTQEGTLSPKPSDNGV